MSHFPFDQEKVRLGRHTLATVSAGEDLQVVVTMTVNDVSIAAFDSDGNGLSTLAKVQLDYLPLVAALLPGCIALAQQWYPANVVSPE